MEPAEARVDGLEARPLATDILVVPSIRSLSAIHRTGEVSNFHGLTTPVVIAWGADPNSAVTECIRM